MEVSAVCGHGRELFTCARVYGSRGPALCSIRVDLFRVKGGLDCGGDDFDLLVIRLEKAMLALRLLRVDEHTVDRDFEVAASNRASKRQRGWYVCV